MSEQQSFDLGISKEPPKPPNPPRIDFSKMPEDMRRRVFLIRTGTSIFFLPNLDPKSDQIADGTIVRNPNNRSQTAYWALMSIKDFQQLYGKSKKIQIEPDLKKLIKFQSVKIGSDEDPQKEDIYYSDSHSKETRVIGYYERVDSFFVFLNPRLILVPKKLPGVNP